MVSIKVDNIKCSGCAHRIEKKLRQQEKVEDVTIDVASGEIKIRGGVDESHVTAILLTMGYPLAGTGTAITTARSFVSCMIGRVDKAVG